MSGLIDAREALLTEAIGETANLIESVERLAPELREIGREIAQAKTGLRDSFSSFETQVMSLCEKAKVQTVKHMLARTDEATRRSIELQSRAIADAARVAFGAEVGAALQGLRSALHEKSKLQWEGWITHAAAFVAGAAAAWMLALFLWVR